MPVEVALPFGRALLVGNLDGPLALGLHGGGWGDGRPEDLLPHAERLAAVGVASLLPAYRLAPESLWPAQREDVSAAVAWLRERGHPLVPAYGESAGGHLAMWAAARGEIAGFVSICGLHDLRVPLTANGEIYGIVPRVLGDAYPAGVPDLSPLLAYRTGMPPALFIHGADDPWVGVEHSEVAAREFARLGVAHDLLVVPGMGHGFSFDSPAQDETWAEVLDFLRRML